MRKLIILGAGGFGREVLQWALTIEAGRPGWKVAAFLDKNPEALRKHDCGYSIIGDPDHFRPTEDQVFVCAVGTPEVRLRLCSQLKNRGARFASLIHPDTLIGAHSQIGEGCVICPKATVSTNVAIGAFCVLNMHCTIGHDVTVGEGCVIACHADITGDAVLGRGVLVGSHGSVLPGVTVGEFAVVGAGSAAYRDVLARTTVIGVPARAVSRSSAPPI